MSNLFKSIYETLDKSHKTEKSINRDPEDVDEEGKNPPEGVGSDAESLFKTAPAPSYQFNRPPSGNVSSIKPATDLTKGSESIFPTIKPLNKGISHTHGHGDFAVDHIGKSCGVCGRLSKSLEGTVCGGCSKSMNSVAWHKSHLE